MPVPTSQPRPFLSTHHRHAFASPNQPLAPLYTHLSPCLISNPHTVLLPSSSTAYLIQPPHPPQSLHSPLDADLLTAAALIPSATLALLAHRSGQVALHSLPPTNPAVPPRTFRPFQSTNLVSLIAVHPTSEYAAFAATDGAIRVYHLSTLAVTHVLSTSVTLTALNFPPNIDTTHLAAGCDDGSICIFDLASKSHAPAHILRPHVARVTSILFPPSADTLVSTSVDALLAIYSYSPAASTPFSSPSLITTKRPIAAAAILPDGRIVTAGPHPALRVWNVTRRTENTAAQLCLPFIRSAAVGKDNASDDDAPGDLQQNDAVSVAYMVPTPSGILVALTDHTLITVDAPPASALRLGTEITTGNLEEVYDVRILPRPISGHNERKDRQIAIASNSPVVWVMRPSTTKAPQWTCTAALYAHTANVLAIDAVSTMTANPASLFVVSASRDRTARVWRQSVSSGRWTYAAVAEGHADAVTAVAMAPRVIAGRFFMVTAAADRTVKRWSLEGVRKAAAVEKAVSSVVEERCDIVEADSGAQDDCEVLSLSAAWTVLAHEKDVNAVAVSPDGSMIATGSQDRTVKVWTSDKGELMTACTGHKRGVWSVAFSSVDRVVVSGSGDSTVRIWSVQNGQCLRTLEGHLSGVLRAKFLSRGTQIGSCGADGLIKVWTTRTGECDVTLDGHEDRVWGLDVDEDGDVMVSGGADGKVVVWEDESEQVESAKEKKREDEAMMGQVVDSAARACEWSVAARGALELGMTQKLKSIVCEVVVKSKNAEEELVNMVRGIFSAKVRLPMEEDGNTRERGDEGSEDTVEGKEWECIERLLMWCRDWNASGGAKSAAVASYMLQAVFSVWTVEELCEHMKTEKRALVEALAAHCQRHMERVNDLSTKVALLEFTLMSMGSVVGQLDGSVVTNGSAMLSRNAVVTPETKANSRFKRRRRDEVECEY